MTKAVAALLEGLSDGDAVRLSLRLDGDHGVDHAAAVASAWLMGATAMRNACLGRQICRVCGCWELQACPGSCWWVEPDLCSSCEASPPATALPEPNIFPVLTTLEREPKHYGLWIAGLCLAIVLSGGALASLIYMSGSNP